MENYQRARSLLAGFAASAWLWLLPAPICAQESQDQLPEMGTAAQATLSLEDEQRIGRMVMRGLRESGAVLDDPEFGEYLQSLGHRLSSLAHDGNRDFSFFLIRDPATPRWAARRGRRARTPSRRARQRSASGRGRPVVS